MKAVALALGLLAIGGCGTAYNMVKGPQVYGGVRQDELWIPHSRWRGNLQLDKIFSFALDTALLPITALFEFLRWQTGWPPPGLTPYEPKERKRKPREVPETKD